MTAVSGFHPLIKFGRINQSQSADNDTEQKRINVKNQDRNRLIGHFADIHKTDHGDGKRNQQDIAAFKIPALFIEPDNAPISEQS